MSANDSHPSIPPELKHVVQACTWHLGIVRDLKDPEGRGRVKIESPEINHTGQNNWVNWCEPLAIPVSSIHYGGDVGIWWPYVPGQAAYVGFKSGDYLQPLCLPGSSWAEKPESIGKELVPVEVKKMNKTSVRMGTRLRVIKSEAGHSLLLDDNGQQEALALVDWTGAGLFLAAPGKQEDEQEKKGEASKPRKGERRKAKTVAAQTSPTPGEITQKGIAILGLMDLNGQGILTIAKDGDGKVILVASKDVGSGGPCVVLDAKDNNAYIGAGDAQMHFIGDEGKIFVTKQMIVKAEPIELEEFVKATKDALKEYFSKYESSAGEGDA